MGWLIIVWSRVYLLCSTFACELSIPSSATRHGVFAALETEPLRQRYIRGHSSADRLCGILQERGRLGRLSAQSPCRSSALGQGRRERVGVKSPFRAARSMVQVFRVGREERRC